MCFNPTNLSLYMFNHRIYPYLCQAVCNFAKDYGDSKKDKECYVSFVEVPTRHKVRELNTTKIGSLVRISGQVVRTHPVHPELVLGTFVCLDCQTAIPDVEQQFKVITALHFINLLAAVAVIFLSFFSVYSASYLP